MANHQEPEGSAAERPRIALPKNIAQTLQFLDDVRDTARPDERGPGVVLLLGGRFVAADGTRGGERVGQPMQEIEHGREVREMLLL